MAADLMRYSTHHTHPLTPSPRPPLSNSLTPTPTLTLLSTPGLIVLVPLAGMMVLAFTNGHVVPNPSRVDVSQGVCTDAQGQEVVCCSWQVTAEIWHAHHLLYAFNITTTLKPQGCVT